MGRNSSIHVQYIYSVTILWIPYDTLLSEPLVPVSATAVAASGVVAIRLRARLPLFILASSAAGAAVVAAPAAADVLVQRSHFARNFDQ